jgi:hypothetical protein
MKMILNQGNQIHNFISSSGSGRNSDPVPTFYRVTVPVPVPLVKKLRFRFRLHNAALRDVAVAEGERAHFEAKVGPVGDPSMVVEWYFNGTLIAASKAVFF